MERYECNLMTNCNICFCFTLQNELFSYGRALGSCFRALGRARLRTIFGLWHRHKTASLMIRGSHDTSAVTILSLLAKRNCNPRAFISWHKYRLKGHKLDGILTSWSQDCFLLSAMLTLTKHHKTHMCGELDKLSHRHVRCSLRVPKEGNSKFF